MSIFLTILDPRISFFFFFNDTATTEIYTLSLHDALPIFIPGAEGATEPGKRRINWVWYWNVPEAELPKLMTGVDGRERDFSVPPGQVREECLKNQDAIAENGFWPQLLELWRPHRPRVARSNVQRP